MKKDHMKITTHTDTGSVIGSLWMVVGAIGFSIMGLLVKMTGTRFEMHEYELVFWRVVFAATVLGLQAALTKNNFQHAIHKHIFGVLWLVQSAYLCSFLVWCICRWQLPLPLATHQRYFWQFFQSFF